MNPHQIEQFRICLLQQLRQVGGDSSLPLPTLVNGVRMAGFEVGDDQVRAGLAYLGDKGFAAPVAKPLSPENKRWRITAAGSDFLAEAGL